MYIIYKYIRSMKLSRAGRCRNSRSVSFVSGLSVHADTNNSTIFLKFLNLGKREN